MDASFAQRIVIYLPILVAIGGIVLVVLGAIAAGVFKRFRLGSLELEAVDKSTIQRINEELRAASPGQPMPFEIEQLTSYYASTLGQAKISFWFSLIFASLGFLVIILAAFFYHESELGAASIKLISGLIIDVFAALFLAQSRRAQENMSMFFEKLRSDRQFAEARNMCDQVDSPAIKDNLRAILVLHYSGLDSGLFLSRLSVESPVDQAAGATQKSVQ